MAFPMRKHAEDRTLDWQFLNKTPADPINNFDAYFRQISLRWTI